jgi:hypothetical protein
MNEVPRPNSLSAQISPSFIPIMVFTFEKPRPVPEDLVVKNGSNILSRCSGLIPNIDRIRNILLTVEVIGEQS